MIDNLLCLQCKVRNKNFIHANLKWAKIGFIWNIWNKKRIFALRKKTKNDGSILYFKYN